MGEDVLYDGVEGGDGVAGEEELLEAGVGGEAGARAAEAVVAEPQLGQLGTGGQQPPHTRPAHTVTVQDQLRNRLMVIILSQRIRKSTDTIKSGQNIRFMNFCEAQGKGGA